MQVPQQNPDQHRAPLPSAERPSMIAPARSAERPKVEPKAEVAEHHSGEHFYRANAAKRDELCRKLEQRRALLRQERKTAPHNEE